ncbi:MAG: S8 family serine peptidase [Candidatus Woesearchaeota archaeon]
MAASKFFLPLLAAGVIACDQDEPNIELRVSGTTEHPEYSIGEEVRLASEDYAGIPSESPLNSGKEIRLKNRAIMPNHFRSLDSNLEEAMKSADSPFEKVHAILQYEKNLTAEERELLKDSGVEILKPLSSKTYIASVPADKEYFEATSNLNTNKIKYAGILLPEDKISPHILQGKLGQWGKKDGMQGFTVQLHEDADFKAVKSKIEEIGAVIGDSNESLGTISVAVDEASSGFFVDMAAEEDDVEYISQPAIPLEPHLYYVRRFSKTDMLQQSVPGLDGEGVKICIYDGGYFDQEHPDLVGRRLYPEDNPRVSLHSTHVACIAAGTGVGTIEALDKVCNQTSIREDFEEICGMYLNSDDPESFDKRFKGIAHKALLYSGDHGECEPYCLYNTPNQMDEKLRLFSSEGVIVVNMSIGSNVSKNGYPCEFNGDYEQTTSLVDQLIYELGIIDAKSASNERSTRRCWNDAIGYGTLGIPSTSKNAIVVGSVTYDRSNWIKVANYSSFGPADDGRVGVTVVNVGGDEVTRVISCSPTYAYPGYVGAAGTSMSSPAVAGLSALIVQAYREIMAGMDPRPELVKALLANTAIDIEEPFVDFKTGYGMVDAVEAHKALVDGRYSQGKVNVTGQKNTLVLNVEDGSNPIKVMLAYTDYPAAPHAEKNLVNDLDLLLISPSGEEYRSFVLDPENPGENAVRGVDNVNNIEQVVYGLLPGEEIEPGMWKVIVEASDVVYGSVDYTVATSHPVFDAEPALLLNNGEKVSGYLVAGVKRNKCDSDGCQEVVSKWLVDDRHLGVKTTLDEGGKLELWRIIPPYTTVNTGNYWIEMSFFGENGKIIENSDGSSAMRKAYFNVYE